MKIMHLADFHLDSAFSGFSKERADLKREELRSCFVNAMSIAKERGVKLVLIPGDLFDTPFCSALTRKTVFDAISQLDCPVVIAPGNHDYYNKNGTYADANLPDNVFVFTSTEIGRFDFDDIGISVLGYAFTSERYEENPLSGDVVTSKDNINILCAHTELSVPLSRYAPMTPSSIAGLGFSYAALGHVHNPGEPIEIDNSLIAYSGFAQGRSFDELGDGGAYIVDISNDTGRATLERIKLSSMRYEIERVDITSLSSDEEVIQKLKATVEGKGYGENVALRIVLTGAVPSDYSINESAVFDAISKCGLALLQLKNMVTATLDLTSLERDITVKGEIYRMLLPLLNSDNENERKKAEMALKFALAALDKREFGI